jgi:hypothetical protein
MSLRKRTIIGVLAIAAIPTAAFITGRVLSRRVDEGEAHDDEIRRLALMNGVDMQVTSRSFRHARIDLGMGGANIDLTTAELAPAGATVELHGAMGGLNLQVPPDWRVTAESDSPTNGLNVVTTPDDELSADAPHLHVVSHARLSGINVQVA